MRPLANGELEIRRLARTKDGERHNRADAIGPERLDERLHSPNWRAIPVHDDVPLSDSCRSAWPIAVDGHHHGSNTSAVEPHRLETKTEIAPRDPTMTFELGGEALDGGRGDYQDAPARPEHRHPERATSRVKRETAFRAPLERSIELDPGVDLTAAKAVPGRPGRGHDAERGGGPAVKGTDHDRQRAGGHWGCIECNRLEVILPDAKDGNIRGRVSSNKLRRGRVAARQDDRDLFVFGESFLGGHDQVYRNRSSRNERPMQRPSRERCDFSAISSTTARCWPAPPASFMV